MLGKLVNKFKRQSLQDGSIGGSQSGQADGMRRSARLNEKAGRGMAAADVRGANSNSSPSPPQNTRTRRGRQNMTGPNAADMARAGGAQKQQELMVVDSGTESDDDELEMLDSMSNASMRSLSYGGGTAVMMMDEAEEDEEGEDGIIGRSPPTLTSSPPMISEIDTSSWDSCGCESGIVLRDSAERDDASRNVDLMEAAFGCGELAIEPKSAARRIQQRPVASEMGLTNREGTTPVQGKDAFPATHFRMMAPPLPIDFSALRSSELKGSSEVSDDDAPTPIGSQKITGQGAALMEAHLAAAARVSSPAIDDHHQGAFRRVLRRTRRNSNNAGSGTPSAISAAERTVSPPLSIGEKRRWGEAPLANGMIPQQNGGHHQQNSTTPTLSSSPIAARTRGSLMGAAALQISNYAEGGPYGGGGEVVENSNLSTTDFPRPVLTAARRARVRVLYSSTASAQSNQITTLGQHGRRGQVAPILGQSPPAMMLMSSKRGRHSSKIGGKSPPRPSLNFDKMRKRMLNGGEGGGSGSGGDGEGASSSVAERSSGFVQSGKAAGGGGGGDPGGPF